MSSRKTLTGIQNPSPGTVALLPIAEILASSDPGIFLTTDSAYGMVIRTAETTKFSWNGALCDRPDPAQWAAINLKAGSSVREENGVLVAEIADTVGNGYRQGYASSPGSFVDGSKYVIGIYTDEDVNGTSTSTDNLYVGVRNSTTGAILYVNITTATGGQLLVNTATGMDASGGTPLYNGEGGDHYFRAPVTFVEIDFDTTISMGVQPAPNGPQKTLVTGVADSGYDQLFAAWVNRAGVTHTHALIHHSVS